MSTKMSRRNFVGGAAAVGALGALGTLSGCASADADSTTTEDKPKSTETAKTTPVSDGAYHLTFNGGPLTAAEQHETISVYDWTTDELSIKEIAEAAKEVSYEEAVAILENEPLITEDYVQEDGKVIPAVYLMLRNRLNRIGQGVGNEIKDGCWDFLMTNFTEEEADLYLKLPMFKYFNAMQASEASGLPYEQVSEMCEDMSYRGLLNRVTRTGVNFYHTLAFAHGILEFMMDQYHEENFVSEVFGMLGADYGYQSRNQGSAMYFTIPAQQDIVGDPEILPYCDWDEIIERNEVIAVSPCQCRTFTPIRNGEEGPMCDHPMETCISTGEQAQYYIENGIGRQLTKEEARQAIQTGVDAGMVIQVMNTQQCDVICQCHGDCCSILRGFIALDGDVENLKYMSNYQLEVDQETCIQCGACADRCPLFIISMNEEDGYPEVGNMCVRCGQCAIACPTESRKLVAVSEDNRVTLPHDMIDDYHMKAIEHAKRGYIVDFDPSKL